MRAARLILLVMCLGAVPSADAGDLLLTCSPGLEIFVDGEYAGVCGSAENGKYLSGLGDGLHTVRIEKSGFSPREFPVVVGLTPRQVAVGDLPPRTTPGDGESTIADEVERRTGTIEITSEPQECTVRIGQRWVAKKEVTMTILDVPVGDHDLWVERLGVLLKTPVIVTPDEPVRINANFVKKRVTTVTDEPEHADGGEPEPEESPTGESGCTAFWVQVLRTSDLEKVEVTQKQLDELGFPPHNQRLITIEDDGVLPLYKLRVGPLVDMWTAKLVMHKIRPTKILGARIVSEPCEKDFEDLKRHR